MVNDMKEVDNNKMEGNTKVGGGNTEVVGDTKVANNNMVVNDTKGMGNNKTENNTKGVTLRLWMRQK